MLSHDNVAKAHTRAFLPAPVSCAAGGDKVVTPGGFACTKSILPLSLMAKLSCVFCPPQVTLTPLQALQEE